jgi:anti-anti-sigma regulatory factor
MGKNFKFLSDSTRGRISLKLYGDFDGSSACELINVLKSQRNGSNQIFIDTDNLNTINPFGMDVLKKNLSVLDFSTDRIIITGKHRFSKQKQG